MVRQHAHQLLDQLDPPQLAAVGHHLTISPSFCDVLENKVSMRWSAYGDGV